MEPNNIEEPKEVEEENDKYDWLKGLAALLAFIAALCFVSYQVGKSHGSGNAVKVIDSAASDLMYNKGYSDGVQFGQKQERTKWCELEKNRKPGNMTLDCLKLFLEGAGSTLMEKNGFKIETL
jgi:hypothetical protein